MRCLVQPDRRSSLASVFHSFITGVNTEPGGALQPEKRASHLSGVCCSRTRGLPIQPGYLPPTGEQARQPLPTAARIRRSWQKLAAGRSRVQGGRRIPGHKRRRPRARPAAAVGRLETSEHRSRARAGAGAAAVEVGAGGWDQSWGGTDARGARPGSRGRPRVAITSLQLPGCRLALPPVEHWV